MILRLFFLTIVTCILFFICGCSMQSLEQDKNFVTKECYSDDNWEVSALLLWDEKEVTGKIEANYLGKSPLEFVIIEPNFHVGKWPTGYTPPVKGRYTWNSEKPEGAIPSVQDASSMSTSILSQKPSRIMKESEAAQILEQVEVTIHWKAPNDSESRIIKISN